MLIPASKSMSSDVEKIYAFTDKSAVYTHADFLPQARAGAELFGLPLTSGEAFADVHILLDDTLVGEAYRLVCNESGVTLFAKTGKGVAHGFAAAWQLWRSGGCAGLMHCTIEDEPSFSWRALNFDICRHFFGVDTIKKVIDLLWLYRFSVLHLHLSDDQGFRIESQRYPELNFIGSFRKSSAIKRGEGEKQDGKPHGGYLTKLEVRELVAYACARGIEIVPEIEAPGHSAAIVAAFPKLACFERRSDVATQYGFKEFSSHILCSAKDEVYEVLFNIIDEVAELFPANYFHIGGDEAKKQDWKKCPACQALKREKGLRSERELQAHMMARVAEHVRALGKEAIVWNDGYCENMGTDVICQQWTPKAVEGSARTIKLIKSGGKAIFSGFEHLYFDYPYSMTPLEKTYSYALPTGLDAKAREGIIGIECCLWTEWIEDEAKIFYNLLPRLAAASELMWSGDTRPTYEDFCSRLKAHYAIYESLGLNYAKNREKAEGYFKRLNTTRIFFSKDAYTEVTNARHE